MPKARVFPSNKPLVRLDRNRRVPHPFAPFCLGAKSA
jgi:hypothetical protein